MSIPQPVIRHLSMDGEGRSPELGEDEHPPLPSTPRRRMSQAERLFREAVCPQTLPDSEIEHALADGLTLGDRLLLDGSASLRRLSLHAAPATMKRLSVLRVSSVVTSPSQEDSQQLVDGAGASTGGSPSRRRSSLPPPPPPPIESEEASAAREAAQIRRQSRTSMSSARNDPSL